MKYIISYSNPHQHFIDIEFIAENITNNEVVIQLPAWRPGRYELGNFAKNVQKWAAFDNNGNPLQFEKIAKDAWKVNTENVSTLHIKYNYYAAEINAGSSYLDGQQLYVNPVNCCVYIPERINETCELILNISEKYKVAIGLKESTRTHSFFAKDFHELADSPFIASDTLQHHGFDCNNVAFNLWFQGECKPDWDKLVTDFTKFINEQFLVINQFPDKEYHFFFQILPYKMYHGVEHTNSTVIALGPGYNLMKGKLYEDLLGVSSHELFHAWNIKTIRPKEMFPYDYTKENYSRLGYVCEGVTTYYGDYMLFRSKVFNEQEYFATLEERAQKHFDNFGRTNLSVADSSFDTWLDGYVPGIPNRKTSIYDEGCLLAFVTDIFIRKHTNNKHSLDDVMQYLYSEFALKDKGYTAEDYKGVVEHFANQSFDTIFNRYINTAANYKEIVEDTLNYIGCELKMISNSKFCENALGIKVTETNGVCKISAVYPDSIADKGGLAINDELTGVNGMAVKPDPSGTTFNEWCNYFSESKLEISFVSGGIIKNTTLTPSTNSFYKTAKIIKQTQTTEQQKENFKNWSKNNF
jgi:predicted metalloprotease with PDZ domain